MILVEQTKAIFMLLRKYSILSFCFLLISNFVFGQKPIYKPYTFSDSLSIISIPQEFEKYNIIILEDKINYNVSNNIFSRYSRFKILSNNSGHFFKDFVIPQTVDPSNDYILEPRYSSESYSYPMIPLEGLLIFDMRIIKPDGEKIDIEPVLNLISKTYEILQKDFLMFNFHFQIPKLEKDDQLEIFYKIQSNKSGYSDIVKDFSPQRVFFNDKWPKLNFELSIITNTNHNYKVQAHNYDYKIDTMIEKLGSLYYRTERFYSKNLYPINNMWNSKFYNQLPYVSFFNANRLIYEATNEKTLDKKNISFWQLELTKYANVKLKYERHDANTINNTAYKSIFERTLKNSTDTSYLGHINFFHNYINEEFDYINDIEFINGNDLDLIRIGRNLNNNIVKKSYIEFLYYQILNRFGRDYYLIATHDNRIGNINFEKFDQDYLLPGIFGIVDKGNIHYLMYKKHKFGHYLNELPFYYEDNNIILIPQRIPQDEFYNNPIAKLIYYKTPSSSSSDNQRTYNSLVQVNLINKKIEFNSKLKLSGQFSTLLRGYYTNKYIDSSVHINYYKDIYRKSSNSNLLSLTKLNESSNFPFTCSFNFTYTDSTLLEAKNDSIYVLPLKNFFNFVIDYDFDSNSGNNYYFDFKQYDTFRYLLKFNSDVVLNTNNISKEIDLTFGKFIFYIKQVDSNSIMIESNLLIEENQIPHNKLIEVKKLIQNIQEVDNSFLEFKLS